METNFFQKGIAVTAAAVLLAASCLASLPVTASAAPRPETPALSGASSVPALEFPSAAKDTVTINCTDSVRIFFPINSSVLDLNFGDNPDSFNRLNDIFGAGPFGKTFPRSVKFIGGASPDGSVKHNAELSAKRAETVYGYFTSTYETFSSMDFSTSSVGRDWEGLLSFVKEDPAVPFRDKTVAFLQVIVDRIHANGEKDGDNYMAMLEDFLDGAPYYYLKDYVFPKLRATKLLVNYDAVSVVEKEEEPAPERQVLQPEPIPAEEPAEEPACKECRPFYMDFTTNLLYDVAMTPNIGVEFYLGRRWSIGVDWQYAWWKNDDRNFYWRTYGGDFILRKWMGRKSKEKPLQGHHLGLYGQMFTYDFELGGTGYLADRWNWGVGLEYGYTLPVAPRLNIDFSIGVGYAGGESKKYTPEDGHYYQTNSHTVSYVGPTRASIGLVWLIGCGNYNPVGRKAPK